MTNARVFRDRADAGIVLADALRRFAGAPGVIVLALPRGGVPVGYEVARALGAPLDVFLVRKIGAPGYEELAFGAIASGGVRVDRALIDHLQVSDADVERITAREQRELARREAAYRGGRPLPDLAGQTVILVDDGLATGSSMRAAIRGVRQHHPTRVVVAVPTGARSTCDALRLEADEVVCASVPEPFHAVGQWYEDFSQTTDADVEALLRAAAAPDGRCRP